MRTITLTLLLLLPLPLASAAHADSENTLQLGLATEHGSGLGLGLELGDDDTRLVVGVGAAMALGYSSVEGWVGAFAPGAGAGVRRYWGGFYLGPTIGANHTVWASSGAIARREGELSLWAAGDVGYHFGDQGEALSFKLGLAGGAIREAGSWEPLLGLTLTLGL